MARKKATAKKETTPTTPTTPAIVALNSNNEETKKATAKKVDNSQRKQLINDKRDYDKSLASAVRFLAEVATGTLDHDGEDISRSLAAKLYMYYRIAENNNRAGRKIIAAKIRQNAPFLTTEGTTSKRVQVNADIRKIAGYTGKDCIYCYKAATWMEALIDSYNNNGNMQRVVINVISPRIEGGKIIDVVGTIDRGVTADKATAITDEERKKLTLAWLEYKDR